MPSQYDNSYHEIFSRPVYDRPEDKLDTQQLREADYIFEVKPPREPTREEELEYMDW